MYLCIFSMCIKLIAKIKLLTCVVFLFTFIQVERESGPKKKKKVNIKIFLMLN